MGSDIDLICKTEIWENLNMGGRRVAHIFKIYTRAGREAILLDFIYLFELKFVFLTIAFNYFFDVISDTLNFNFFIRNSRPRAYTFIATVSFHAFS